MICLTGKHNQLAKVEVKMALQLEKERKEKNQDDHVLSIWREHFENQARKSKIVNRKVNLALICFSIDETRNRTVLDVDLAVELDATHGHWKENEIESFPK